MASCFTRIRSVAVLMPTPCNRLVASANAKEQTSTSETSAWIWILVDTLGSQLQQWLDLANQLPGTVAFVAGAFSWFCH